MMCNKSVVVMSSWPGRPWDHGSIPFSACGATLVISWLMILTCWFLNEMVEVSADSCEPERLTIWKTDFSYRMPIARTESISYFISFRRNLQNSNVCKKRMFATNQFTSFSRARRVCSLDLVNFTAKRPVPSPSVSRQRKTVLKVPSPKASSSVFLGHVLGQGNDILTNKQQTTNCKIQLAFSSATNSKQSKQSAITFAVATSGQSRPWASLSQQSSWQSQSVECAVGAVCIS